MASTETVAPTAKITSFWPKRAPRVVHRPYVWLAGLEFMDVLTTGIILGFFVGSSEGNPIVRALFDHTGLVVGLLILLIAKLVAVAIFWTTQFPVKIATAVYGMVVFNNLLILGLSLWSVLT